MKKLLLLLLFFTQSALTAEETLIKCRQIEEISERVVCYDNIVDSHFPTDSSDAASSVRVEITTQPEVTESNVVPDAQSLFGTNDAEAKRLVEKSMDIEQISEIEAIVTDVRNSATKRFTVSLDNGQIWRQLDDQRLTLKSGDAVVVRKASFGSYLMEKMSGSRSIRVTRLN